LNTIRIMAGGLGRLLWAFITRQANQISYSEYRW
jgi:hypothetical protein